MRTFGFLTILLLWPLSATAQSVDELASHVVAKRSELHQCYVKFVPESDRVLHGNNGKIEVRVQHTGYVAYTKFTDTTVVSEVAKTCMLDVIRSIRFPTLKESRDFHVYVGMDSKPDEWVFRAEPPPVTTTELLAVVKADLPQLIQCFEDRRKLNPLLRGSVEVRLTVHKDGGVAAIELVSNTVADPAVGDCVIRRIRATKFPAPTSPVILSVPISFSAE